MPRRLHQRRLPANRPQGLGADVLDLTGRIAGCSASSRSGVGSASDPCERPGDVRAAACLPLAARCALPGGFNEPRRAFPDAAPGRIPRVEPVRQRQVERWLRPATGLRRALGVHAYTLPACGTGNARAAQGALHHVDEPAIPPGVATRRPCTAGNPVHAPLPGGTSTAVQVKMTRPGAPDAMWAWMLPQPRVVRQNRAGCSTWSA